jgi:hypothetical protein
MTTISRDLLKSSILEHLAEVAVEHPAGHQGKLAARFILRSQSGEGIELMFEKGPSGPANLWVHRKFAEALLPLGIEHRESSARMLYAVQNETGKKMYGRHTGLLAMPQLADADLVCFKLQAVSEIVTIVSALQNDVDG